MPLQRKLGFALVALGLVGILTGVIYILEVANGPGTGPKTFAERNSYNQVKERVHASFPVGLAIALGGLGLTMVGARALRKTSTP